MQKKGMHFNVTGVISLFVGLIVLFLVVAAILPSGITAGNSLNTTLAANGLGTWGGFFAKGGVIWIVLMAALLLAVVVAAMAWMGGKKYK